ncbi:MAG: hypothetical protein WB760_16170 [Xanthobacteraceae bacterium]
MEIPGAILLYTLAAMMVTFTGFFALLLSLRQAVGVEMSQLDRLLAKTVVSHLFLVTWGSLLPPVLGLYGIPDDWIWRISAVLFAVPMLIHLLTYPYRRRRADEAVQSRTIYFVFVVLGSASLIGMLVYVLTDLPHSPAAYITALLINFFTLAFVFVVALDYLLKQQPVKQPEK